MTRHEEIWEAVRKIPRGRVATYGQIATLAGMDGQPRLVGYALHALPKGSDVPWHRVINASGKISLPPPFSTRQRRLLEAEGIRFTENKINLKQYQWEAGTGPAPQKLTS